MDYEVAVSNMARRELRAFAIKAAETLEVLERENARLKDDIQTALTVDMEVIKNWRGWCATVNEERDKWADTATRLTVENRQLESHIEQLDHVNSSLLKALRNIAERAAADSGKGTTGKTMRGGLEEIQELADGAIAKHAPQSEPEEPELEESPEDTEVTPDDES
jgi:hypothetical protein